MYQPYKFISRSTALHSWENLCRWLDNIVLQCSHEECLLQAQDNNRVEGIYHNLKQEEHNMIESKLSQYISWSVQCEGAGCSASHYLSIEGAGWGHCMLIT